MTRTKITIGLCLPVTVELVVELQPDTDLPEEDWEFDIKDVAISMMQSVTVTNVNEALVDDDYAHILQETIKAWKQS